MKWNFDFQAYTFTLERQQKAILSRKRSNPRPLPPLTGKNASGSVAQIYAEVRKRRTGTLLTIENCIHR